MSAERKGQKKMGINVVTKNRGAAKLTVQFECELKITALDGCTSYIADAVIVDSEHRYKIGAGWPASRLRGLFERFRAGLETEAGIDIARMRRANLLSAAYSVTIKDDRRGGATVYQETAYDLDTLFMPALNRIETICREKGIRT